MNAQMNATFRGAAAQFISKQHPVTHKQVCLVKFPEEVKVDRHTSTIIQLRCIVWYSLFVTRTRIVARVYEIHLVVFTLVLET